MDIYFSLSHVLRNFSKYFCFQLVKVLELSLGIFLELALGIFLSSWALFLPSLFLSCFQSSWALSWYFSSIMIYDRWFNKHSIWKHISLNCEKFSWFFSIISLEINGQSIFSFWRSYYSVVWHPGLMLYFSYIFPPPTFYPFIFLLCF